MDKVRSEHVRGMMREIVLKEIDAHGSMHGYALIRLFRSKLKIYLGPSTVYPMLKLLEKEELIVGSWQLEGYLHRLCYSLTAKGKAELIEVTADLKLVLQTESLIVE